MLREELKKGTPIIKSGSQSIATSNSDQVSLLVNDSQTGSKLSQPDTTPISTEKSQQGDHNLFVTLNKKKVTTSMLSKVSDYSDPGHHLQVLNMGHPSQAPKGKRLTRSFYRGKGSKKEIPTNFDQKTLDQQVEESICGIIGQTNEQTPRKQTCIKTISSTTKGAKDSKDQATEQEERRVSQPDLLEEIFLDYEDQDSNLLFCNSATLKGRRSPKKEFSSFGPQNPNQSKKGQNIDQNSVNLDAHNFFIQIKKPKQSNIQNSDSTNN